MRRWTGHIAALLVAGILAGCGGNTEDSDTKGASSSSATANTTARQAPAAKPGSIDEAEQRLTGAGYTVSEQTVSGPAMAAREVDGVLVYEYPNGREAQTGYEGIRGVVRDHPDRGAAIVEGRRVYFLGKTRELTERERAAFAKIVNVAEGR